MFDVQLGNVFFFGGGKWGTNEHLAQMTSFSAISRRYQLGMTISAKIRKKHRRIFLSMFDVQLGNVFFFGGGGVGN